MKVRNVLLAATMLAVPAVAFAGAPVSGVYVGAGAGFDYLNSQNAKHIVLPAPVPGNTGAGVGINNGNLKSNGGFVGLGSVGWGFGNGLRAEVELNYRQNNTRLEGTSIAAGGGNFQQRGAMVNALYDFTTVAPWVSPYVGIGFGYVQNRFQNGVLYSTTLPNQATVSFDQSWKGTAAGQAILGAAFETGIPGLAVTTEFRFIGQFEQLTYNGHTTLARPVAGGSGIYGTSVKFAAPTNESFLVGLRYAFNAAPPPPPPAPAPVAAPAPAPARTYLVFFDWDRADLSARAKQVIAEAAQASTRVQLTQIEVNGFTDTSGSAQYNMGLSIRRANNVAAELVRLGVPKQAIAVKGFGQTHLLVPTADGVREPQNRRVEIILK